MCTFDTGNSDFDQCSVHPGCGTDDGKWPVYDNDWPGWRCCDDVGDCSFVSGGGGGGDQWCYDQNNDSNQQADSCWSLNGDQGPWCPDWASPGREASTVATYGDRGWDACCYGDGCDIGAAVYDDSNGVGWSKSYWKDSNSGDTWGGGVIYDWCQCDEVHT